MISTLKNVPQQRDDMARRVPTLAAVCALVLASAPGGLPQTNNSPLQLTKHPSLGPDLVLVSKGSCTISSAGKPPVAGYSYAYRVKATASFPCAAEPLQLCDNQKGIARPSSSACPAPAAALTASTGAKPPTFLLVNAGSCVRGRNNAGPIYGTQYILQAYRYTDTPCQAAPVKLCDGVTVATQANRRLCPLTPTEIEAHKATLLAQLKSAIAEARAAEPVDDPLYDIAMEQTGLVTIQLPDGKSFTLAEGDVAVFSDISGGIGALPRNTTISTQLGSSVLLRFTDESTIRFGDDASLTLDEYVFDPAAPQPGKFWKFLRGIFYYVGSKIAKPEQPPAYETSGGGGGIRGTTFELSTSPSGAGYIRVTDGIVDFKPKSSPTTYTLTARQMLKVDGQGRVTGPLPF